MKIKAAIFFILILLASACVQKTCPTYSKDDIKKQQFAKANEL